MKNRIFFLILSCLTLNAWANLDAIKDAEDRRDVDSQVLQVAMHSSDPKIRERAAIAYGNMQSPKAEEYLSQLLFDKSNGVSAKAAFGLGQLAWKPEFSGGHEEDISKILQSHLSAPKEVRLAVIEAIGKIGFDSVPSVMLPLLQDKDANVRAEAVMALYRYRLVARLRGITLKINDLPEGVLQRLESLASDRNSLVRRNVAYVFARIKDARALNFALKLATDPNEDVRLFAVTALGKIAKPDAKDILISALKDTSYPVRVAAIVALKACGLEAQLGAASLTDSVYHVRMALAQNSSDQNILSALLKDSSASVRAEALKNLAGLDQVTESTLEENLKAVSFLDRQAAVMASTFLKDKQEAFLHEALKDSDVRVRMSALEALGSILTTTSQAALEKFLMSPDVAERGTAISSLGNFPKSPELISKLWDSYKASPEHKWFYDREFIVDILVTENTQQTTDLLTEALKDPAYSVATKAKMELEKRGIQNLPQISPPPLTFTPYRDLTTDQNAKVEMKTDKGTFVIECYSKAAPIHVANFLGLVNAGFYNGKAWHRIVSNFVVQGGNTDVTGGGTADYSLRSEINSTKYKRGTLGMPRSDDFNSGDTELFITHIPTPHLDGQYTVFGQVIEGMDVIDQLEVGDQIISAKMIK